MRDGRILRLKYQISQPMSRNRMVPDAIGAQKLAKILKDLEDLEFMILWTSQHSKWELEVHARPATSLDGFDERDKHVHVVHF